MIFTIYIITNSENEKVYIGQTTETIERRFQRHKEPGNKSCVKLHNAIAKYGRDNFITSSIVTTDNQLTADFLEKFWIKTFNSVKSGYNIALGGTNGSMLGRHHTDETKKLISDKIKGRKLSDEHKKKMSDYRKGKPLSEMHKLHLSKPGRNKGKTWKLIDGKRIVSRKGQL